MSRRRCRSSRRAGITLRTESLDRLLSPTYSANHIECHPFGWISVCSADPSQTFLGYPSPCATATLREPVDGGGHVGASARLACLLWRYSMRPSNPTRSLGIDGSTPAARPMHRRERHGSGCHALGRFRHRRIAFLCLRASRSHPWSPVARGLAFRSQQMPMPRHTTGTKRATEVETAPTMICVTRNAPMAQASRQSIRCRAWQTTAIVMSRRRRSCN